MNTSALKLFIFVTILSLMSCNSQNASPSAPAANSVSATSTTSTPSDSCPSGYHSVDGDCVADLCTPGASESCYLGLGFGSQVCSSDGTAWSACGNLTSCDSGYSLANGSCVIQICSPNSVQSCEVGNGIGTQTCSADGLSIGACGNISACVSGYTFQNGACVALPTWPANPPLSVKQTAPLVTSANLDFDGVVNALQTSHSNSWSQFGINATNGYNMDVLDVVDTGDSTYRYLGVSHSNVHPQSGTYCVNLTYSTDLKNWTFLLTIDCSNSSQPAIRKLADSSYLLAYEYDPNSNGAEVKVRYYSNLAALVANQYAIQSYATRTPGALNDGTPSFRQILYTSGGFSNMQFELTHHFCMQGDCVDQEGFDTWNWPGTNPAPWNVNNDWMTKVVPVEPLIKNLGVKGNIGGRDSFDIGGNRYFLVEGETTPNDWSSWHLYLIQEGSNKIAQLDIQTPKGSQSMGNPKLSFVTLPNGKAALVGSTYIFSQQPNGDSSEAGSHFYAYPFD